MRVDRAGDVPARVFTLSGGLVGEIETAVDDDRVRVVQPRGKGVGVDERLQRHGRYDTIAEQENASGRRPVEGFGRGPGRALASSMISCRRNDCGGNA